MPDAQPTPYAPLAKEIRSIAESIDSRANAGDGHEDDRQTAELHRCLARLLEGKEPHEAFGAIGDWGYGTPIGKALKASYTAASA